jgi:hypothetical protein
LGFGTIDSGSNAAIEKSRTPITLIMRGEYSESNNSKMIEFALLPLTNPNLTAAREKDRDDESAVSKYNDDVFGFNFESRSVGGTPVCHRLDQVLDFINMGCSRLSVRGNELAEEGLFRLENGIDNNSVGVAFQW